MAVMVKHRPILVLCSPCLYSVETYRLWRETETKSIYKKAYFGAHIQKGKTTDVGNMCLYHMLDDLDNSATI